MLESLERQAWGSGRPWPCWVAPRHPTLAGSQCCSAWDRTASRWGHLSSAGPAGAGVWVCGVDVYTPKGFDLEEDPAVC